MARFVGRENVRKRLAPLEGEQGRTSYANGVVRIELPGEAIVVRPPFGLAHEHEYETVRLAPLLEALTDDHIVAALLVRLGGYAVGVFDGERLVASKVGSRFVKNRHKKGGSSANRFRRRREEQARALIEEAAEVAALGGDRGAISEVLAASPQLGWLAKRAIPRFFTVPEPRQRELERLPYDVYSAKLTTEPKHDRPAPDSP
jgi:hypothetical protein